MVEDTAPISGKATAASASHLSALCYRLLQQCIGLKGHIRKKTHLELTFMVRTSTARTCITVIMLQH